MPVGIGDVLVVDLDLRGEVGSSRLEVATGIRLDRPTHGLDVCFLRHRSRSISREAGLLPQPGGFERHPLCSAATTDRQSLFRRPIPWTIGRAVQTTAKVDVHCLELPVRLVPLPVELAADGNPAAHPGDASDDGGVELPMPHADEVIHPGGQRRIALVTAHPHWPDVESAGLLGVLPLTFASNAIFPPWSTCPWKCLMLAKASVASTPTASAPMPTISVIRLNGDSLQKDNPVWAASVSAAAKTANLSGPRPQRQELHTRVLRL